MHEQGHCKYAVLKSIMFKAFNNQELHLAQQQFIETNLDCHGQRPFTLILEPAHLFQPTLAIN